MTRRVPSIRMLSIGSGSRIRRVYSGTLVLLCGAAMVSSCGRVQRPNRRPCGMSFFHGANQPSGTARLMPSFHIFHSIFAPLTQ
jgi:hypothetical protein